MSDTPKAISPKISVLTPSTRPDGLPMVADCLGRQTERDFEWIICVPPGTAAPADLVAYLRSRVPTLRFLSDPPRRPGDFYRLNGAFNTLVRASTAHLLVFAVDWIWFGPQVLERFLTTFTADPAACVSSAGNHFRLAIDGRPEVLWSCDPRLDWVQPTPAHPDRDGMTLDPGWCELSLAALPRDRLLSVGGFDEDYDRGAGCSEKELALRLAAGGSPFYLGQGELAHRIFTHPKADPSAAWDAAYRVAHAMLVRHAAEIKGGSRRASGAAVPREAA